MTQDVLVPVFVNPLVCFFADEAWSDMDLRQPDLESLLEYLCTPGEECSVQSVISRYREIKDEPQGIFAAPSEPQILEKLIWPLRNAKASYMLGNYLGTVSLCGTVAEMIAILLFDISRLEFRGAVMTEEIQKTLFGSTFEKLGQDRRVSILLGLNVIDPKAKSLFDEIRRIRKRYLHFFSQDHSALASDAVACYQATLQVVISVIGQEIRDGKIALNPKLMDYLHHKGIVQDSEVEQAGSNAAPLREA